MHHRGGPDSLHKRMATFEAVSKCLHNALQSGPRSAVAQLAIELKSLGVWDATLDEPYFRAAAAAPALPSNLLEHVLDRFEQV